MSRTPIKTAYCRYDGEYPCTINGSTAIDGFNYLGIKIIPFYGFGDIETDVDCGPLALIHGYIGDVHIALKKLGLGVPDPVDYPEELHQFLGRKIWKSVLKDVTKHPGTEVFVKPVEQKLFTGFLWQGTYKNRLRVAIYDEETPVFLSTPIKFVAEYRCFVLDQKLIDVRRYNGDWSIAPDRKPIEDAVQAWIGPRAYAMDFGVTDDGRTLLVEVNDAYALGSYGLDPVAYARMIEARWEELTESLVT